MKYANFPSKRIKNKYSMIVVLIAVVFIAISTLISDYQSYKSVKALIDMTDGLFTVHYIDVGQGDATLIKSPKGEYMLIDSGTGDSINYLLKYLSDCDVSSLEYFIITHPHEDHYGGANDIIESIPIENFVILGEFADTYPYNNFCKMLDNNTKIHFAKRDDKFTFDDCAYFSIISPEWADFEDYNESSLAFNIKFGATSFLFTGDAESSSEREMLFRGYDVSANVYKAAHHGSSTSNTKAFVEAVNPEYAVFSCAKDNSYGHPHKEVKELFESLGIKMFSTADIGDIVFVSDGVKAVPLEDYTTDNAEQSKTYGFFDFVMEKLAA